MQPDFRAPKPLWLVVLLLQLALPGLAVVADARVDALSRAAGSHVESLSHECDEAAHPPQCALCQFAGSHGTLASGASLPPLPDDAAGAASFALPAPPPAAAPRGALPRGPPSLV